MTRGKIIFVDENGVLYSSLEFNGDMYPDGSFANGGRVIRAFRKGEIQTVESYKNYVKEFDDANFGYAASYGEELIRDIFKLDDMVFDVRDNLTDYLYIVNQAGQEVQILTKDEEDHLIPDGDLGIVYYSSWERLIKAEAGSSAGTKKKQAEMPNRSYKQIIIARKDLEMSSGKLAAQCCHASVAFLTAEIRRKARHAQECYEVNMAFGEGIYEDWIAGEFTKCILQARNQTQLLKAAEYAGELGLEENVDYFLIRDNCHTELSPEEYDERGVGRTLTCIGFRPMDRRIADQIGKKFHLYV